VTFTSRSVSIAQPYRLTGTVGRVSDCRQIFLHIPKCAGTTVLTVISACARHDHRVERRFPVTGTRNRDFLPRATVFITKDWTGAWDAVERSKAHDLDKTDLASGHFPFGVHRFMTGESKYVTTLRDPVAREISSFNFHCQRGFLEDDESLERLLDDGRILDNPQTRMIAGLEAMSGPCTEATLNTAKHNLQSHFVLVGVTEKTDEFIAALLGINGWPAVVYPRAQVTKRKVLEKPPDSLLDRLGEYHECDVQLHEYAVRHWEDWKEQHLLGIEEITSSSIGLRVPKDFMAGGQARSISSSELTRLKHRAQGFD
jgi:hypothetical protein